LLFLVGCKSLNPLCGSARPAPVLSSLSANLVSFAQVQQGYVLTVTGKEFVSSSVVLANGTTLVTTVVSNQELQVTLSSDVITGPESLSVTVKTPSGTSGSLGCSSGGTSAALPLAIT
jgi:hypothetical protein